MNSPTDLLQAERMVRNELVKLDRIIADKKREVQSLIGSLPKPYSGLVERPRRYSIEYEFTPTYSTELAPVLVPEQTKTFLVEGGRPFRIDALDTSLRVVGQATVRNNAGALVAGQTCSVTLPWGLTVGGTPALHYRNDYFDFFWRIRDNTTDREYQNVRQPSVFLLSGVLGANVLPIREHLPGGTEIAMTVEPTYANASPDPAGAQDLGKFFNIRRYILQVSFVGVEVLP